MLDARGFAAAYAAVQDYEGKEGQVEPSGPMVDAVMEFIREQLEQQKESRGQL